MLRINDDIEIPESELQLTAIRASGPGGQNVNKVATAIHLRFDIGASAALPEYVKNRLLALPDRRITSDGIVNIKAQRSRSQDKNRVDALKRLGDLVRKGLVVAKARKKTRPSRRAKEKRLENKSRRSQVKRSRGRIIE